MARISRLLIAAVAAIAALSACSSSAPVGGVEQASGSEGATTQSSTQPIQQAEAPAPGQPTATIVLSTGETYQLDVRSCQTQSNDPDSFFTDDFFDLSGVTLDGAYRFSANNVETVDGTFIAVQYGLTGDRDENGVNPRVDYFNHHHPDHVPSQWVVDGGRVTGDVVMPKGYSQNPVFGDNVSVSFEFNCG